MVLVATQVKRRRGTTAENDAFTGAEGEITVDTEKHELRVHDGVTQGGFKIGGAGGAMPVGAIFTTPRTGTIEGAVEANGNPYNIADYSGDGSIGALLTAGNIAYVSKAEFQTQVTNTGACGSFGWDGTSDTTFLVPKLNPWHIGKSAPVSANVSTLTFGNGGSIQLVVGSPNIAQNNPGGKDTLNTNYAPGGPKTISNMNVDLSETTNLRVMVQLATGATDQALETCTSVLADVSALNAHKVIEFQAPTAENGYTWYRKYADGWVEQGGLNTTANDTTVTISLPITMFDNNYTVQKTCITDNSFLLSNISFRTFAVSAKTTTSFQTFANQHSTGGFNWQVSGKSAQ